MCCTAGANKHPPYFEPLRVLGKVLQVQDKEAINLYRLPPYVLLLFKALKRLCWVACFQKYMKVFVSLDKLYMHFSVIVFLFVWNAMVYFYFQTVLL